MENSILFTKSETITISIYTTPSCNCPLFHIESDNEFSSISDIIEDTLKLY